MATGLTMAGMVISARIVKLSIAGTAISGIKKVDKFQEYIYLVVESA
jgi:hypothetical protein